VSGGGERSGKGKWRLGSSPIEEVLENFPVTRDQIQTVLDFAAKSAQTPLESLQV